MLLNRNQLPLPEAIHRPAFEQVAAAFKQDFLNNIKADNPRLALEVEQTLSQPGELITKMLDTFSQYLLNEIERRNQQALQLLPGWSEGTNLDNLVAHQGLARQVIVAGDNDAFPPVAPVMESDDALLQRYLLQSHAPAAGSRMKYKADILMLDEKPVITLDKPADHQVRLTYTFNPQGVAASIKDGAGLRTAPGKVTVTVLGRDGNGVASEAQLAAVRAYFARDDVAPGTDEITVQSAEIVEYQQVVTVHIGHGPDPQITTELLQQKLQAYAQQQHRLGSEIQPDYINHLLFDAGVKRAMITSPANRIECLAHQAPWCTDIQVEVLRL